MICPICGGEMEEGGLIASGISVMWFPLEQFAKKGLERLWYGGGKSVGKSNYLLGHTRIPGAYTAAAARKSSAFSIFPMIRKGSKTPFYPHCAASKLNGFDTSEEVLKKGGIYYDGGRLQ